MRFVNAYEVTLGYGGSEEGGWWFDVGTPLASVPCETDAEVEAAKASLAERFKEIDAQPDKSSTARNAGNLQISVEDCFAEAFPQERPFYE
jgi:hypothetical protein